MNKPLMKEFKLEDLFDIISSKSYDLGNLLKSNKTNEKLFNFVGRTEKNNGIQEKIPLQDTNAISGNVITISQVGTIVSLYQKSEFYKSQNIIVYSNKHLNKYVGLYFKTLIDKHLKRFVGYNTPKLDDLNEILLLLPVKSLEDTEPDYEYMENFIKEVQNKVVELKIKEDQEEMKRLKALIETASYKELDDVLMKEFKLGEFFNIYKTQKYDRSELKETKDKNSYNYVTRTMNNNGILCKTEKLCDDKINEAGTFSLGLMQMSFFYQEKDWYAGQFVRKIVPKEQYSKNTIVYFHVLFNKIRDYLSSGLVRDVDEKFLNHKVLLPVKSLEDTEPDYEYMNLYIQSIYYNQNKKINDFLKEQLKEIKIAS